MSATPTTLWLVSTAPARLREPEPAGQVIAVTLQADDKLLITVPEAARRLGISRSLSFLYELIAAGQVRTIHIGRLCKVSQQALDHNARLNVAGTVTPTDLLLPHPTQAFQHCRWIDATPILPLNTCFVQRPDHMLGQIGVVPLPNGPKALTVTADPTRFEADLSATLAATAIQARRAGLLYSAVAIGGDAAARDPEHLAAGGASLNTAPTSGREPKTGDIDSDRYDPNLGETSLGLW